MKKLIIISVLLLSPLLRRGPGAEVFAQVMVNYGTVVYMANDTIFADGGIYNYKDSVGGAPGSFRNSGQVYVTNGDWTNSSGNVAFAATPNNSWGNSTIDFFLISPTSQKIKGTSVTEFYKLNLTGGGVKQLDGINATVKDSLNLNDREFATGTNTLFVTNTNTGIITRSSGFVSSLNGGALVRKTQSSNPYFFPVGTVNRFRPVEITPDNSSSNDFAVAMIDGDAGTNGGFSLAQKEKNIGSVNDKYYHQIRRDAGSAPVSISMYFDDNGVKFAGMAHWQNQPQWEDIVATASAGKYGLNNGVTKQGWDFSSPSPAFALITLVNECGEMFVPTAFSPDNNGENDIEFAYGKCIQKIYFAIYDRWGEKMFETNDITKGWDGTYKGKEMNTGVFVYYLTATLTTGKEVIKKGNISLFR